MMRTTKDISEAVRWKLTPSAYSYEGQMERLEERLNLQERFLCDLVEKLNEDGSLTKTRLLDLVNSYDMTLELE